VLNLVDDAISLRILLCLRSARTTRPKVDLVAMQGAEELRDCGRICHLGRHQAKLVGTNARQTRFDFFDTKHQFGAAEVGEEVNPLGVTTNPYFRQSEMVAAKAVPITIDVGTTRDRAHG
jgi:hypothetical protein